MATNQNNAIPSPQSPEPGEGIGSDARNEGRDAERLREITEAYTTWATGPSAPDFDAIGDDLARLCSAIQEAMQGEDSREELEPCSVNDRCEFPDGHTGRCTTELSSGKEQQP